MWNLKHLKDAMTRDLQSCHTDFERHMCRTVCGQEIRKAAELIGNTRKLTPGEIAIASEFGYRAG